MPFYATGFTQEDLLTICQQKETFVTVEMSATEKLKGKNIYMVPRRKLST